MDCDPRYVIHDEDGPLRAFWTRTEAEAWMLPGMRLVIFPRPRKVKLDTSQWEPAPF